MFDLKNMSWDQLDALQKEIQVEKDARDERRFEELAKAACDALNAIKKEYPYATLEFSMDIDDFGEIDIDVFEHYGKFMPHHFTR